MHCRWGFYVRSGHVFLGKKIIIIVVLLLLFFLVRRAGEHQRHLDIVYIFFVAVALFCILSLPVESVLGSV
jgi:hypothetical protein